MKLRRYLLELAGLSAVFFMLLQMNKNMTEGLAISKMKNAGILAQVQNKNGAGQKEGETAGGRAGEEARQQGATTTLPGQVSLDVPLILQKPELPTGCESVALTMALSYLGIEIDKTTIARDYLVYNYEDENMALGYVGDPFSAHGAGCFAPALCKTAENFLADRGLAGQAQDLSGAKLEDLFPYVASGTPVIVWTTMYMAQPEFTGEMGVYRGREYRWYRQEHCVLLSGYDLEAGTLRIHDPLEGIVHRNLEAFRQIYEQTGQHAMIVNLRR